MAYKVLQSNQVTACKECGKEFTIEVKVASQKNVLRKIAKKDQLEQQKKTNHILLVFQKQNRCYSNLEIS